MPYRLSYEWWIDYVGPGTSVQTGSVAPALPMGGRGGAQTKQFSNKQGGQNSQTFTSTDITNLIGTAAGNTGMAGDVSTQLTAALTQIQGFATGGG